MKRFNFHIILFSILLHQTVVGQVHNFKNYNADAGISNTTILDITQLNNGEIWIGTNEGGINTFDGNSFTPITKENGLVDNVIYDFLHDKEGNVWISTNNGVSIYNGKTFDSISCVDTLVHKRIYKTFIDSKNTVWFCTGEGLAKLVDNNIVKFNSGNEILDATPVIFCNEDHKGNIWLGTMGENSFKISPDGKVTQYSSGRAMKYTFSIFHPNDKTTWFLTYKGLFELIDDSIVEKKFKVLENYKSTYFHHCYEDNDGNYWFATKKRGVIKLRGTKEKLFTEVNGLGDNHCWRIFQDREHNMWFGGQTKGLSKLPNETFELKNSNFGLPNDNVQSVFTDSKSQIWIGTENGLFNKGNELGDIILEQKIIVHNDIRSINEDQNNNIHIVMKSGVKIIRNGISTIYNLNSDEQIFKGYCSFIDSTGVLYGGVNGIGIIEGDYIKIINDSIQMPETPVLDIEKDHQGVYWFATDERLI